MIEAVIVTAGVLAFGTGLVVWGKIDGARLDREERLKKVESELAAIKAAMPKCHPSAVDNVVAAFALGAAFAQNVSCTPAPTDPSNAKSKSKRSSDINDFQGVTTTAATTPSV